MPIIFRDVSFTYNPKSPMSFAALNHLDFAIEPGSFIGIVGRTGCGKSTLIQQINALLHPSEGEVDVDGFINSSDKKKRTKKTKELRRHVGLVFQFPEYQLFEETVEKDVAFGPKNFGVPLEQALIDAHEALARVGLGEAFYPRSPFELSGGEKRRVAIAGVLAYHPDYLILDEPTAGLDPEGAKEMMDLFRDIHSQGTTIILVTHDMDIVAQYCDDVLVFEEGKLVKRAKPQYLFEEDMETYSLETPKMYRFLSELKAKGFEVQAEEIFDVPSLAEAIARKVKGK